MTGNFRTPTTPPSAADQLEHQLHIIKTAQIELGKACAVLRHADRVNDAKRFEDLYDHRFTAQEAVHPMASAIHFGPGLQTAPPPAGFGRKDELVWTAIARLINAVVCLAKAGSEDRANEITCLVVSMFTQEAFFNSVREASLDLLMPRGRFMLGSV